MTIMTWIRHWLGIKPAEDAAAKQREVRELVHAHRNIAACAVAESQRLGRAASSAEHATRQAIRRLEAAKRGRGDDDRMAHSP
jgi:hypothetical protein